MKLGDVLKKEREKAGVSAQEMSNQLGLLDSNYASIEAGDASVEHWAPLLAQIAIALETPTSRFIAKSGKSVDARPGECGQLIRQRREYRQKSVAEMVAALGVSEEEYREIESGHSPIEEVGPILLRFAEVIRQPIFNLFYPCGLPFQELDDYP